MVSVARRWSDCFLAAMLSVLCMLAAPVQAQDPGESGWARHNRIFVVPAPKNVKIDGKLDDWDLSGMIQMYVVKSNSDVQSGKLAMMYDKDAFYLGAEVRDVSPMMNRQDPTTHGDWGWDADSFQMRMVTDAALGYPVNFTTWEGGERGDARLLNLLLWYYTDNKEPVMQADTSMSHTPIPGTLKYGIFPKDKFQAAYRLSDDKRGYTFEYRIPWNTLPAQKVPKAGDVWPGTCQFNWGRADGLRYTAFVYDVMSKSGFPYQSSSCWGRIQFSAKGHLPRELVEDGVPPEKPMPLRFEYDLPKDGEVTVELFNDNHEIVRTIAAQAKREAGHVVELWDGLDDAGKPVPPGNYTWKGLYHDPITTKFILSVHNSGNPPYKTDDNTGGWGGDYDAPRDVCVADNAAVMCWAAAEAGWGIIRTDLDGKKKWGTLNGAVYLATDGKLVYTAGSIGFDHFAGVRALSLADGTLKNFGNGETLLTGLGKEEAEGAVSGLAWGGGILYVAYVKQNQVMLFDSAQGTLKATWNVPSPGRMAARPDGGLLVVSDGKVLLVRDGAVAPFLTDHLDDPQGVMLDGAGNIYVSNRGKLSNIAVFAADGKYQRSIGKDGGRPARGKYDPDGVYMPGGMAIDARGRLWVAETADAPRRVSVWDTATGKLAKEFFGGSCYSTFTWMDPKHADEVYCHDVRWKIDLDKKTWAPDSTVWRSLDPNSPRAPLQLYVFTAKNGRQYAWGSIHPQGVALYLRDGDLFKPCAAVFVKWGKVYDTFPVMQAHPEKYTDGGYGWIDANNDQLVQENEVTRLEWAYQYDPRNVYFGWVDEDLNLWSGAGFRYHPLRIDADGRPAYDFNKPEQTGIKTGFSEFTPLWTDSRDGSVYTKTDSATDVHALARWGADGKLQWAFRGSKYWADAVALPPLKPGKLWGMTGSLGVAGEYTGMADYFGVTHLIASDGLYVAMLGKPNSLLSGLSPEVTLCEYFYAQLVKPEGGNRYFLLHGDQDGRISEVLGLDTVKRLPGGVYTISQPMIDTAMAAYADYQAKLAKLQNFTIIRTRAALEAAKPVRKVLDDTRSFEVKAAYDEKNLYLQYNVSSPSPLITAIPDYRLLFKGGNLLDILLATDPAADPKRKTPAPGDLRILISRRDNMPVAVIYQTKVKGFTGKPEVLSSPTGSESFDAITETNRIGLTYSETPGVQGFQALVTIPFDLLGWVPKAGGQVAMDVGYIFGNANGTQAMKRSYWHNNSFTANIVNDVPNESRLQPSEWGKVNVE